MFKSLPISKLSCFLAKLREFFVYTIYKSFIRYVETAEMCLGAGGLQGALVLYVSVQKEFSERQSDR